MMTSVICHVQCWSWTLWWCHSFATWEKNLPMSTQEKIPKRRGLGSGSREGGRRCFHVTKLWHHYNVIGHLILEPCWSSNDTNVTECVLPGYSSLFSLFLFGRHRVADRWKLFYFPLAATGRYRETAAAAEMWRPGWMERCCLVLSEVICFLQTFQHAAERAVEQFKVSRFQTTVSIQFTDWHTDLVTCRAFLWEKGEIQINIHYFMHFCFRPYI